MPTALLPSLDCVRAPTAQEEWARCRPWIEAALTTSPAFETIEDVERLIGEGRYQFWAGRRGALITEIVCYARRKALSVVHGGGALDELLDAFEPALNTYARAHGCDAALIQGRKGWEKASAKYGFRFGYTTLIKDLNS